MTQKNKIILPWSNIVSGNIILILIFLIALIFRFYQFENWFEWSGNQSLFAWELKQLADGHLTLVGFDAAAIGGLRFPPFQLYMLLPFFIISGQNPLFGIQVFLIILGGITSVMFYKIGLQLFGKNAAFISAGLYALTLNAITIDRKFNGSTFMVIFTLMTILYLAKIIKQPRSTSTDFIILGSIIGLGFSMHYQTIFILLASFLVLYINKNISIFSKKFLIFTISILFWLTPLLIFDIRHDFFILKGIFILRESYTYQTFNFSGIIQSANYIISNFSAFLWKPAYFINFKTIFNPGVIIIFALGIIFAPLFFKTKSKSDKIIDFFVISSFFGFVVLSFYNRGTYNFDYYYWFAIPGFIFTLALFIEKLIRLNLKIFAFAFLLSIVALNFKAFTIYEAPDSYKVTADAIRAIYSDAQEKNTDLIIVQFFEIHPGQTDYIFYLIGKDYDVSPEKVVLVADQDLYLERTLTKSPPPVKIVGQSTVLSSTPNYLFEKSFKSRNDKNLIYQSGKYKVYSL